MAGKLIIIESGSDGSGKATQTAKLYERLAKEGYKVRKVEYPNYKSDSSALVKMYLNGDFGSNPEDVDPYIASTFYTVDRYASYKKDWQDFYINGGLILADRYTTSNMVHQAAKIQDDEERDKYLEWLWDFEYQMYKLPIPDKVLFLDMPPENSKILMEDRANKITGSQAKDIHESNDQYLISSYQNSLYVVKKYNWTRINCVKDNKIKNKLQIHEDIYKSAKEILDQ